ncbi:MAG: DUF1631 family protein [Rubrivivax sp.]
MSEGFASPALQQFVDDELLRAPLLFDQVIDGTLEQLQAGLPGQPPSQRQIVGDLMSALKAQRGRLADYYMRSLHKQLQEQATGVPNATDAGQPRRALLAEAHSSTMALMDEAEVAVDVELSHAVEAIRSVAEYELRELQTYVSALVGDMDVARDHNPFRAETHAHALWAAAHALTLSHGHQVSFMRHAGVAMAQQLRRSYAASSSRLESMGIEPAAYRTLILPAGSRHGTRSQLADITIVPGLHLLRTTMHGALDSPPAAAPARGQSGHAIHPAVGALQTRWHDVARHTTDPVDRRAIELMSRLFETLQTEDRIPADIGQVLARLQGPAMRLTLRESDVLDQQDHPLWRFVNRVGFESEMSPDAADPERRMLLKLVHETVEQIAAETEQNAGLYRWAIDRLDAFLDKRHARRLTAAASHIAELQALEAKLDADVGPPTTLHGMLDVPQLDTVPAELLPDDEPMAARRSLSDAEHWLSTLKPGTWVRLFLQGRWVRARLLWPGERREIWLFSDGASDQSWAVRRGALLMLHAERLAKTLKQRNLVGSAAARLQAQMAERSRAA